MAAPVYILNNDFFTANAWPAAFTSPRSTIISVENILGVRSEPGRLVLEATEEGMKDWLGVESALPLVELGRDVTKPSTWGVVFPDKSKFDIVVEPQSAAAATAIQPPAAELADKERQAIFKKAEEVFKATPLVVAFFEKYFDVFRHAGLTGLKWAEDDGDPGHIERAVGFTRTGNGLGAPVELLGITDHDADEDDNSLYLNNPYWDAKVAAFSTERSRAQNARIKGGEIIDVRSEPGKLVLVLNEKGMDRWLQDVPAGADPEKYKSKRITFRDGFTLDVSVELQSSETAADQAGTVGVNGLSSKLPDAIEKSWKDKAAQLRNFWNNF